MPGKKPHNLFNVLIIILMLLVVIQGVFLINLYRQDHAAKIQMKKAQQGIDFMERPAQPTSQAQRPMVSGARSRPRIHTVGFSANPFMELQRMQEEMDRVMGSFFQHAAFPFQSISAPGSVDFLPSADVEETKEQVIYRFDVPGLEKDKIHVKVQNGVLLIQGERKSEKQKEDTAQGFYSSEVRYGSFSRSMPVPPYVNEDSIEASYEQGVLTITFDKIKDFQQETKTVEID
jgi:HSP20 family protein